MIQKNHPLQKEGKHTACVYSISKVSEFDDEKGSMINTVEKIARKSFMNAQRSMQKKQVTI